MTEVANAALKRQRAEKELEIRMVEAVSQGRTEKVTQEAELCIEAVRRQAQGAVDETSGEAYQLARFLHEQEAQMQSQSQELNQMRDSIERS